MSFSDAINGAIFASQQVTGALLAAKAGGDASSPLALAGVSNALRAGAEMAANLKVAADLVQAVQPANDRESVHD